MKMEAEIELAKENAKRNSNGENSTVYNSLGKLENHNILYGKLNLKIK